MVRAVQVVLRFFFVILINTNVDAASISDDTLGLLSKLFGKNSRDPMIIVVGAASKQHDYTYLRSDDQNQESAETQRIKYLDGSVDEKISLQYVSDILRSTGNENDPDVRETNIKFENALRSRCEKFLECQLKCKKPKKKNQCKSKCEQIYDRLAMCNQKKKKKDPCARDSEEYDEFECGKKFTIPCKNSNKCGRTLPPDW